MVFANLTVEENLELGAYRRKDKAGIKRGSASRCFSSSRACTSA